MSALLKTPAEAPRAIRIAVLAMGGEGGGVLADWIVDLAEHGGYIAQIDLGTGRRPANRRDDLLSRAVSRRLRLRRPAGCLSWR